MTGLLILFSLSRGFATDRSWSAGSNTTWGAGANWVGGSAPSLFDNAVFNGTFTNQPNVTAATTISGLWMTGSVAQNVTISGASTLTLGGGTINGIPNLGILMDNTNAFTLTIDAPIALRNSAETWLNNSSNVLTIGAGGVDNNKRNLTIDGTGSTTITGVVSNSGDLIKSGSGTLTLSGANTYSGATTVSAGVLNIRNGSALGATSTGTTVNSGAALQIQGGIAVGTEALTLNGSGISNDGALRNVSSNNSWSGAITLGSASTIASDSGTLTLSGTLANSGFTLTTDGAGSITENGVISGTGAVIKYGTGTLTLSAVNTYSGGTTINAGTIAINSSASLGSVLGALTLNAGTLEVATGFTTSRLITLGSASSTFQVDASQTYTVNSVVSGTGKLNKTGSGTMILGGVDTFSGGTDVVAGTLEISASDRLLSTAGLTISGGTFNLQAFNQTVGLVTLSSGSISGTGIITGSSFDLQSGTVSAIMAGIGAVTKSTSGTVILSGVNTYTGSTNINTGTLQVNTNGALGATLNGTTVAAGATLKLNSVNYSTAEALTLNGSGVSNTGALLNSGTSTFSGAINIATNASISAGGGTLTLTGGIAKNGTTLTLMGGGTIRIMTRGITGSSPNSDLVVDGTTVILDTPNSYNGPTTIQNSGTIQLGANNVFPTSPQTALTINTSSTLNMASYSDGVASRAGDSSATVKNSVAGTTSTLTVNPGTGVSTTYAGVISGTNSGAQGDIALIKSGAGTLVLSGSSTYGGGTTVDAGALFINNSAGSGTGSGAVTVNAGTLGGSGTINGAVSVAAGANLSPGASGSSSTAIFHTGSLTLSSGSSFILDLNSTTAGTGYDQVSVTGTLNITGCNLVLNPGSGLTVGDKFYIVLNDGAEAITGTFAQGTNITVGNDVFQINYADNGDAGASANDISLTLVSIIPEPSTWMAGAIAFLVIGRRLIVAVRQRPARARKTSRGKLSTAL